MMSAPGSALLLLLVLVLVILPMGGLAWWLRVLALCRRL